MFPSQAIQLIKRARGEDLSSLVIWLSGGILIIFSNKFCVLDIKKEQNPHSEILQS